MKKSIDMYEKGIWALIIEDEKKDFPWKWKFLCLCHPRMGKCFKCKFWSLISIRKAKTSLIPVNNVGYSILSYFLNEKFE